MLQKKKGVYRTLQEQITLRFREEISITGQESSARTVCKGIEL